jgi:hypothetical protein
MHIIIDVHHVDFLHLLTSVQLVLNADPEQKLGTSIQRLNTSNSIARTEVDPKGLEPLTSSLQMMRSSQLS